MSFLKTIFLPSNTVRRWELLIVGFFLLLPLSQSFGSVLVAPTSVFLSEKSRTARMVVRNPTSSPKEVEIRMGFGIPTSDSLGYVNVNLSDSAVTDPHSCMEWIKPFPRKLVLQPGASQTVRFIASPPKGLEDGEYWSRVIIKSQESKVDIPVADDGAITTNLNMIMQTAIALKYRTGDLTSTLELNGASATMQDNSVDALVDLTNKGNVSYVGRMNCSVMDADDKVLGTSDIDLAVYYDLTRRVIVPLNTTETGDEHKFPYKLKIHITNEGRTDIEPKDRVYGNQIDHLVTVE